ncbi:MAG: hypothetical protein LBI85_04415, partial [Spirochaetaceae bacterium]|nr:hypothetical protein [Spirochaetaceae bacterium]
MDKYNIVQKTVIALVLAGTVMLVVIPLLYFAAVALSSAVELSEFPKRMIPSMTVTVRVVPEENGEFEILYDRQDGRGYRSVITSADPLRL